MVKEKRFRGSLSNRVKRTPLLYQHLDRRLIEFSSDDEINHIYRNLYEVVVGSGEKDADINGMANFYLSLPKDCALSYSGEGSFPSEELWKVMEGKKIAEDLIELIESINLLNSSKFLSARHVEYRFIVERSGGKV